MNLLSPDQRRTRRHCSPCGKWAYTSRKQARHTLRTARVADRVIAIYRCPADDTLWHLGHDNRPPAVNP